MIQYSIYFAKRIAKKIIKYEDFQRQLKNLEYKVIYEHINKLEKRIEILENNDHKKLKILNFKNEKQVSLKNPISQLVTQEQFEEDIYFKWCKRIKDIPRFHRKQWEFIYILQVLEKYNMIIKGYRGIGFGVGREPIPDYLSSKGVSCIASDLEIDHAIKKGWVQGNEHAARSRDLQFRFISKNSDFKKNVKHCFIDMNNIPEVMVNFDFAWSACALEHLGSIEKGLKFIERSLECIRPGGIVVHTTEFNMSSLEETIDNDGTVLFRYADFEKLKEKVCSQGHEMELSFYSGEGPMNNFYDIPPYSENNHLRIKLKDYITTSIGVVIRKGPMRG